MSAQLINFGFKCNFLNSISRGSVNIRSLTLQIHSLQWIQNRCTQGPQLHIWNKHLFTFLQSKLFSWVLLQFLKVSEVLAQRSVITSCNENCSIKVIIDVWTGTESVHVFSPSIGYSRWFHCLKADRRNCMPHSLLFLTFPVRRKPCVLCGPSVRHLKCAISSVCSMLSRMQTDRRTERATSPQRSPAVMVRPTCQGLLLSAKHNVAFVETKIETHPLETIGWIARRSWYPED